MKTTILRSTNSMNRSPLRAFFIIPLVLACFALSPQARAVCQDGCLTNFNTVQGDDALVNNTSGDSNTAIGFQALFQNTTGEANTAMGLQTLFINTTGFSNTATGLHALFNNNGSFNTATGRDALYYNTTGGNNTATGEEALVNNTSGNFNTATGSGALEHNTTASFSTATGYEALVNSTGSSNTANGYLALSSDTTGFGNTAIGTDALLSNSTGANNIALGNSAGVFLTTGSNNIDIGNQGIAGESKHIRIGTNGTHTHTFIAGISGATVAGGVGVIIDTSGHLGTIVSSARFKDTVRPMDKASEAILALKPVTFRYKHELDPEGIPQFGLVAEDVEKVNPDLVARDADGKPYTVRYEAVNAMLLNEFLKEHRTVQELEKQVEKLTAGLQKVSTEVEMSKPAPQTVLNNQ